MRYSDLSEERKEARREAAREWKARNRARRVAEGYVGKPIRHPKPKGRPKQDHAALDAWWEKLKKKHEGQPRLTHSIKPPIFLGPDRGIGA